MNAAARHYSRTAGPEAPQLVLSVRPDAIVLALEAAHTGGVPAQDELRRRLRWMEIRAKLIDPEIAGHGGHILQSAMDRVLVEFATAADAVRCAIELQRDISAASASGLELPSIELRIAITQGGSPAVAGETAGNALDDALALGK